MESRGRRIATAWLCLALAAALWIPCVRFLFTGDHADVLNRDPEISPYARGLAARHLTFWRDPERRRGELGDMRRSNAEWDFMGRTYVVLALANMALRDSSILGSWARRFC